MLKEIVYNQEGEEVGKVNLPADVFGLEINQDLICQAVNAQRANARESIAHTKDRSEVSGGGKKPWRQKGTGRARHGSNRSPIWKGGGVTFGPTNERVFTQKINKKMKQKSLLMALSSKVKDEEIILLDKLDLTEAKTKKMAEILNKLKNGAKKDIDKGVLIVLPAVDQKIITASRNLPKIKTIQADSLNIYDILNYHYLLMPKKSIKVIQEFYIKQ
ncbi:50S ribosomal protein L4 [Patescibacteria group bacterium]|nr:50S ribosomal protein L4 [Patescibacteria group bacterium]MBU4082763.1 50S ribosomal protein L4 [Patescibacteria group bacterium]